MRFSAIALAASAICAAWPRPALARPAEVADFVNLRSGPGLNFAPVVTIPPHGLVEVGRCRGPWCSVAYAGAKGYVAAAALSFVAARPVEAPMLPPLGAYVWRSDETPLFDPYDAAGPWYTGPWRYEGAPAEQWRYGFPGGHVAWHRGLGWRPGFGWF